MAYALSGVVLSIAAIESFISNSDILPPLTGPILAVIIISFAFGYTFVTRNNDARMVIDHHHYDTIHPGE
jgi:nickel/cobalt transporter (NiCoT) family protein